MELLEEHITNNNIKNIIDLIKKGYYRSPNILFNEEICSSQLDNSVQSNIQIYNFRNTANNKYLDFNGY